MIIMDQDSDLRAQLLLKGLDCADCAQKLADKVAALPNVKKADINFGASKLNVVYVDNLKNVISLIKQSGYGIVEEQPPSGGFINKIKDNSKAAYTVVSGFFLLMGFLGELAGWSENLILSMYMLSAVSGGYYVARSGIASLKTLSLDMNFLMTLAVVGAIAIGEYSEGAMVVFLYSVGNTLQAYTMDKTRRSIRELIKLAPKEAIVLEKGLQVKKQVEQIVPGEIVMVRPGERIPVDGTVVRGSTSINQAAITGESMPVPKGAGDKVYTGTVNQNGAIEIQVDRRAEDTTLAKIIHLVEEAQAQKAPSQQFVDLFARYYTPAVVVAAVLIAFVPYMAGLPFMVWLKKALILLVIACPCALVISTPVTIVAGIGNAARNGVLIKGGAHLERAGSIDVVAFDKTGTLTMGRPVVVEVVNFSGEGTEKILEVAAAAEQMSEHPVAVAIHKYAAEKGIGLPKADEFQALPGRGVRAVIDGVQYFVGNVRLFNELGSEFTGSYSLEEIEKEGKTLVLVGTEKKVKGLVVVADTLRPNSKEAVDGLWRTGIKKVIMLTGDNNGTAKAVAKNLNISDYEAELLPEDKLTKIKNFMHDYGQVAMVGDGINDAPAMAAASVGIAMGGAGTDSAMEAADIVLMSDDITKVPFTIRLSRKGLRIIKENIAISLAIKFVFIVLTLLGMSNLWMAVFADTGAALIVIANGMRLAGKRL